MAKKPRTSDQSDIAKLDAALGAAERLIRAVRSTIHATPRLLPPDGPGGGRPCRSLEKAEGRIREAEIGIAGGKPCGGGRPCVVYQGHETVGGGPFEATKAPKSHRRGKKR